MVNENRLATLREVRTLISKINSIDMDSWTVNGILEDVEAQIAEDEAELERTAGSRAEDLAFAKAIRRGAGVRVVRFVHPAYDQHLNETIDGAGARASLEIRA